MTESSVTPSRESAKATLRNLWQTVINEENYEVDSNIDRLINSSQVSIRFCLPTQLLGKLTDMSLDTLCLQKGRSEDPSMWNPRTFATDVIVPWIAENQSVLWSSTDPYVGKPLRKPRLEKHPENVKKQEDWVLLFEILDEVERRDSAEFTRTKLLQTLRSVHRRLSKFDFVYPIPSRISMRQTEALVSDFLSESSGGDRGLSVTAALLETFGEFFGLYQKVVRHAINASDQATGLAADIECMDEDGGIRIAVEVKERLVSLTDLRSSIAKAKRLSLSELFLSAPGINLSEESEVSDLITRAWRSGTNVYQIPIEELIRVGLSLTGEEGRIVFVRNVGNQLDSYNTQPVNRLRWRELLDQLRE